MGISNAMQQQGAKPHGFFGRMIGIMMNRGHKDVYRWGLDKLGSVRSKTVLDLGCGGGAVLNMVSKSTRKACGVDHSEEMIRLARQKNRKADNAEIKCASVLDIPYPNSAFDAVTAFETVQHWPDIEKAFREAHRVLASTGIFLIVNRYPKAGSKWTNYLKLKNAEAYKRALEEAGFTQVTADMSKPGWICVTATR